MGTIGPQAADLNSAQRVQRGVVAAIELYRAAKGPLRACAEAAVVQWVASGHGVVGIDVNGLCRGRGGGQQAARKEWCKVSHGVL